MACDAGYHLESFGVFEVCEPNRCGCTNGQAAVGVGCLNHVMNACSSCDTGYYLGEGKQCEAITCQCPYGQVDVQLER